MANRRRALAHTAWLLFASCLSGCCATPPNYYPAVPPPFMEETIAGKVEIAPVRATLGVPTETNTTNTQIIQAQAMVRTERLTLADAVRETLQSDPKIRAGAENIIQARADLWTASLPPNPTLTTSGTLLPWDRGFTVDAQGGPPQFDIGVSFPIDWLLFGKRRTAMNSAKAGVDVSGADYADLIRQRIAGTVAAFYDVLEAKAMLDLAREDADDLKKLEKITKERVKLGGVGTIEQERARLVVLDSEREVRKRSATFVAAKAALRAQLGRRGDEPDFDVAGSLEPATLSSPPSLQDALSLAEQFRPDIVSLRLQVDKAATDVVNERRKAWPDVTPRVGYTRQFQQTAIGFPDVSSWGIGMDIGVPLIDRKQGNILKAESVFGQNKYLLQAQLVQVRSDLEQALQDYRVAYESLQKEAPERIKTARLVRDRIEEAWQKAGGRPYIEVLDAYRAYRDVRRTNLQDQSSYWHSLHRLNATIGKQVIP